MTKERKTLLQQVAALPGYELRDGKLYYMGWECSTSGNALSRILDRAGWPCDAMG